MWEASPLYLLIIGAEIFISNYQQRKVYTLRETITNFYLSLLNGGLDLLIRGVYLIILTAFFKLSTVSIGQPALYWFCLFILLDFQFYWLHRLEHFCRLFWAVHVTHHSSENMNVTVAFRSSVFQPLYRFVFFLPLAFLGFQPMDILFMYSVMQFWTLFVHTELVDRLGVLELFLVTPSHHRVHHASNTLYLDRNMGMCLIIWDRLFGTFQKELRTEEYESIRYGLTSPVKKQTAITVIFHEWSNIWKDLRRKDLNWKLKLQYALRPPGWSHDGSRLTSDEMRRKEFDKSKKPVRMIYEDGVKQRSFPHQRA